VLISKTKHLDAWRGEPDIQVKFEGQLSKLRALWLGKRGDVEVSGVVSSKGVVICLISEVALS
jgi:hypothetical protein